MKIVIIGAGAAGLVAARHGIKNGHNCEVFEMRPKLGGTWIYTDDTDEDEFGYPVYSATYKSLRANIPKEVMGFPDFPIPTEFLTYPTHEQMLKFLEFYSEKYDLNKIIKFNCFVEDIRPNRSGWDVSYIDKLTRQTFTNTYDVVMICSGNYNEGNMPDIPGMSNFKGPQYHSRQYRTPEKFKDQTVLVVGAGPSGADLALEVSTVASKVLMSNHSKVLIAEYPKNVEKKPDIKCLGEHNVVFTDGTMSDVDAIFYCTGFKYSFPYLDESCGIKIKDNYITPLYKHIIHMEKPSMCFIGIPVQVCAFPMFDLQSRFYMKYLDGSMQLPSLELMRQDTDKDMKRRLSDGYRQREAHVMGPYQQEYYDTLAKLAGIETLPVVLNKVRDISFKRFYESLGTFRSDKYDILDDETYRHII